MADPAGPHPPLCLIVLDGGYDRIHYALVLASAAAAIDRPVTLFFSGRALVALTPGGWRRLERDPKVQDAYLGSRNLATFETLLDACRDLGVRFVACEMGLRAMDIGADDLAPELAVEIAGAVTALNAAAGGQMTVL